MVHESFRAMVMSDTYPCVASRGAVRRGDYRFGCYPPIGTGEGAVAAAADLWEFIQDFPIDGAHFASFVATFDGPIVASETEFERLLFLQLELMNALDVKHHAWDPAVGDDPNTKGFSFSFAGRAFFIVGLHPASSRWARRTAWPTLVFNAHAQFDILRDTGQMPRMTDTVRRRDIKVQGSHNPSLGYFDGDYPETVMYSGRLVEADWHCPMHIQRQP